VYTVGHTLREILIRKIDKKNHLIKDRELRQKIMPDIYTLQLSKKNLSLGSPYSKSSGKNVRELPILQIIWMGNTLPNTLDGMKGAIKFSKHQQMFGSNKQMNNSPRNIPDLNAGPNLA